MRRFVTYLFALGMFTCLAVGCHCQKCCEHGICDCYQLNNCCTRQPWVMDGVTMPVETTVPPKKL